VAAGSPVAEKERPVMAGTVLRNRHLGRPEVPGPIRQYLPEIQVAVTIRSLPGREPQAVEHLRSYFITTATNTYSTVDYEIAWRGSRMLINRLHAAFQHPARDPSPPRMQQGDRPLVRGDQVDRDAIG